MKKLELALLFLLPFAMNGQDMDGSLFETNSFSPDLQYSSVGTKQSTWSQPMLMVDQMPTDFSIKWGSQPLKLMNSQTSSLCGSHEVPNYQNVCIKPVYIEGCEIYQTPTSCETCAKGYRLNSNKKCDYNTLSTATITHIKGCIKQKDTKCQTCAEGFYQSGDKCHFGTLHCTKYKDDGSCLQCETDYSLILAQCKHNNLLGCKYETKQHTCTQCYPPFQLVNNLCKISDCRILNDYGCVSCECGFYLTTQRTCQSIAPGCLRYQKGVCKDCLAHYKLKGGVCEIEGCLQYDQHYCKECSNKYDLVEGQCKFKNCYDWLNDQCLACEKGFVIKNSICEQSTSTPCS